MSRNNFMLVLHREGKSYRELGNIFNISYQRVGQIVDKEKRRTAKYRKVRESREAEDLRVAKWLNTNDLWKPL